MNDYNTLVNEWKDGFTNEIKLASKSRKQTFTYLDALQKSKGLRTAFDDCMINYKRFIKSNPLQNNDYSKYVDGYSKDKEFNLKYFKHDKEKLKEYRKKIEENKGYNPFNKSQYEEYVLYMMLKLSGNYKQEYDDIFNVKFEGSREFNPLTRIPSVLRGELPFQVKEYDICRAFYTFICNELGIEMLDDVYSVIDKKTFNTLLNLNFESKGCTIESVRKQLVCVFGNRVNEVITDKRFNTKGQTYHDLTVYEKKAIDSFVTANNLTNFLRLHDGCFVLADVVCDVVEIENVKFSVKECIKPEIINEVVSFYYADENGENITTNEKMYSDFLVQEGFVRVTEIEHDKITIFKNSNNVIIPYNIRTDMVSFLKSEINEFDTDAIEIKIAKDNNSIIQNSYLLLDPIPLKYHRDTTETFGIAFKNGFVEFTKGSDNLTVKEYKEINGFFSPNETQKREFIFTPVPELSVFQLFFTMVSTGKDPRKTDLTKEDENTLNSFCSMFGYLIHQYKDPSQSPSIILSDAGANDLTRNGGRGKSLVTRAVSQVRKSMLKGGSEFDPTYLFNFADLTKEYDVYIIDDVHAGFNYNALYTNISGAINCQRKGKPAQEIPFSEAPKFVITTNWSYRVEDDSTSTQRRFIEYQFTEFFNLKNTPKDVFGHILFDDWDAKEWNRFYNFAFYCVGYYLEFGLQRIHYNKTDDNFRASFNNDVILDEMERIINELLQLQNEFSVSDFLNVYKKIDNNLRFENYFNHKNTKHLIDVFIKHNNLKLSYSNRRKWVKI